MGTGKQSKNVERALLDLQKRKEARAFAREQGLISISKWVAGICATWVPLQAVQPMVEALAGKDTEFTGALSISLVYSGIATVGWAVSAAKSRSREKSLLKLRARAGRMGLDFDLDNQRDYSGGRDR